MMTVRMRLILVLLCLVIELAHCQTNEKQPQDPSCSNTPCSCCLDTATCNPDGRCGGQCKDGYFNGQCKFICPDNCISCKNSSLWAVANCTQCKDGHYSTSELYQCQLECSTGGCQICNSITDCTSCLDGYFKEGTTCTRCKTGCDSCTSNSDCSQCLGGYYNSGGPTNNLNCISCSDGCINQCDSTFGTCTCKSGFTGSKCDTCVDGYYSTGTDCVSCSNGCSNQCNDGTGACSCKYGFDGEKCDICLANFNGTDCDRCINNYHGSSCDQTCPPNCKNKECRRNDGICSQGCIENFTGSKCNDCAANNTCDECIVGKHGPDCTSFCSSDCKDTKCGRDTGSCDSCPDGKYGDQCNLPCPPNCEQSACIQHTGACIGGCTPGYSGDKCCLKASNCKSCSSTSQCSECLPSRYGKTCDDECPTNCADGICDKTNGTCNGCIDGFQGESCALALTDPPNGDGPPGAAIGGGVAGAIVVIVVVVVVIIILRRRPCRTSGGPSSRSDGNIVSDEFQESKTKQTDDIPAYINVIPVCASEAKETRKAVEEKIRQLQKYQQKEAEYAEKDVRIHHELNVIQEPVNNEDGANSGAGSQTYESLNQQEAGNHLYSDLGSSH